MKRDFTARLKALEDSLTTQDPVAIVEPVHDGYLLKTGEQKGAIVTILDVDAPLRAMNTLKMFAQKALSDFNGYSAACLANDKFCQKFIDMMDVLDGKELLTDTIEE